MTRPDRTPPDSPHVARQPSPHRRRFAPRPLALALAAASLLSLPARGVTGACAGGALAERAERRPAARPAAVVNGQQMTVTNSANSILNWQSFSIGADNGVHFAQPDAASKVLNRVVGNDPSAILGSLSSNGGVWLLNPNGVLFGQGARVDVGGLVTSTLRLQRCRLAERPLQLRRGRHRHAGRHRQPGRTPQQPRRPHRAARRQRAQRRA